MKMLQKSLVAIALFAMIPTGVAVAQPSLGTFGSLAISNAASTVAQLDIKRPHEEKFVATLTAYTSRKGETDNDPFIAANGDYVYDGMIACSREYPFGTQVTVNGRTYTCADRMATKNDHAVNLSLSKPRFDIWMDSLSAAKQWGRRDLAVVIHYPNAN